MWKKIKKLKKKIGGNFFSKFNTNIYFNNKYEIKI